MGRLFAMCIVLAVACSEKEPRRIPVTVSPKPGEPGKTVWVDPKNLEQAPCTPKELTAGQVERITAVQKALAEHDPSPLDRWLEDFRCEPDPERELRIYEAIAQTYSAYLSRHPLGAAGRRDLYRLVYLRSSVDDAEVLRRAELQELGREQATEVLRGYPIAPRPPRASSQ